MNKTAARTIKAAWWVACVAALGACSDDTAYQDIAVDCGQGQSVTIEGVEYCVFDSAIIEEGFRCPDAVPFETDFETYTACAPGQDLPGDFPDEVETQTGLMIPGPVQPDPNPGMTPNPDMLPDMAPDANPTMEPDPAPIETGDCFGEDPGEPFPPANVGILFSGGLTRSEGFNNPNVEVIGDNDTWQQTLATFRIYSDTTQEELDALAAFEVDFEQNWIVVAEHSVGSTCLEVRLAGNIVLVNGREHVQANFLVGDGTCEAVCDAEGHALLVAWVPRITEEGPTVCHSVRSVCNE